MSKENEERAARAQRAIVAYINSNEETRHVELHDEATLSDLIADAMHLFGKHAVLEAVHRAELHYKEEIGR
jgi:hypothetical protein